ncbi:hypothetical protein JCM5353_005115 [Sporobolomyces roseus]
MHTPLRSRHSSSNLSGTPSSSTNTPTRSHSVIESKRSLGNQSTQQQLGRVPGTPLGRVLAAEGLAVRSPRRIRQKSLPDKAKDWVSNRVLSLETSIQLFSFDKAGYPLAITLNSLHFLIRLPHFYSALPPLSTWISTSTSAATRYARQAQLDADERLAALQGRGNGGNGWWGWSLSLLLVAVSIANTMYLASRRRKYQLMLRKDPLSSPNARSATLRFAPQAPPKKTLIAKLKNYIWPTPIEEPHSYPIQELHVWTPEYVLWSLRLFTGYPPPVALMYHFLSPSTFIPFLFVGSSLIFLIFSLVHLYTTLLKDRQILSSETMHEYNSTFVYPRVFVQKRDFATSTEELEFQDWRTKHYSAPLGQAEDESEGGSARRVRRGPRESVAVMQGIEGENASASRDSPARRRRRHTEMPL